MLFNVRYGIFRNRRQKRKNWPRPCCIMRAQGSHLQKVPAVGTKVISHIYTGERGISRLSYKTQVCCELRKLSSVLRSRGWQSHRQIPPLARGQESLLAAAFSCLGPPPPPPRARSTALPLPVINQRSNFPCTAGLRQGVGVLRAPPLRRGPRRACLRGQATAAAAGVRARSRCGLGRAGAKVMFCYIYPGVF